MVALATLTNIRSEHLEEWISGSSIAQSLAEKTLSSIDNKEAIAKLLNWKAYSHVGGWHCNSVDLETGQYQNFGQFKPDLPIQFPDSDKPQKYLTFPKGAESEAILLPNTLEIWQRISNRAGIPIVASDIDESRHDLGFWQWVLNHPEISILITEGAKKAACLLTCGWVAIALTGIWNGQQNKKLHPSLAPFIVPGRKVDLVYDADIIVKKISAGSIKSSR